MSQLSLNVFVSDQTPKVPHKTFHQSHPQTRPQIWRSPDSQDFPTMAMATATPTPTAALSSETPKRLAYN